MNVRPLGHRHPRRSQDSDRGPHPECGCRGEGLPHVAEEHTRGQRGHTDKAVIPAERRSSLGRRNEIGHHRLLRPLGEPENGGDFLQDGNLKVIETKGNVIHAHYVFDSFRTRGLDQEVSDHDIIAISNDDGKTWFFADKIDYENDSIFNPKERLIKL